MPSLTGLFSRALDRVTDTIERADVLDPTAEAVDSVATKLPPGLIKDTLSGSAVGHPVHPVLVQVPLGAFVSASFLDVLLGEQTAARRLIELGVLSSVPASLAGLSDWSDTRGAERRVGLVHMTLNTVGLGLYGASWWARRGGRSRAAGPVLAFAGLSVIGVSGWLGGHMSYAMGVGVDTTAFQKPPTTWTDAVPEANLTEGKPVVVTVEDTPILFVRLDSQIHAIGDRCTHRGGPLHEGTITDGCVVCPWHHSKFDLRDGAVVRGPATRPEPLFQTRVVDGQVQVRRDEERSLRLNPTS
jgi:nitrite reductase/ring-hydroxylating ferredoxin subunit/uncharacterized membrane protein